MTLVEILVAAALGAMVLYVIVSLLIPALRVSGQGTAKVDLDQRGALLDERLTRALKSTTRAGTGWLEDTDTQTDYLTVHPLIGTLTRSRQSWSGQLTVFSWAKGRISQWQVDLPADPPPIKAIVPDLPALLSALETPQLKFQLDGVREFKVEIDKGPRVDINFLLEKGTQQLKISRSVFLVNSSQ